MSWGCRTITLVSIGLGAYCTGNPTGVCRPDEVGRCGSPRVSCGRIHLEDFPGDNVFRVFSGSASTVLLGAVCSILHMLADRCAFISAFSRMFNNSVWSSWIFCSIILLVGLDASSRGSSPCPAARRRYCPQFPGPFADILELYALLLVPVDVLLVGLVPRVVFVSLEYHEAFDVQHSSHASSTQRDCTWALFGLT